MKLTKRVDLVPYATFSLTLSLAIITAACAQTKLGGSSNNRKSGQQLGGDSSPTCLKLGDVGPTPPNGPGQTPTQFPGAPGSLPSTGGAQNTSGGKNSGLPSSGSANSEPVVFGSNGGKDTPPPAPPPTPAVVPTTPVPATAAEPTPCAGTPSPTQTPTQTQIGATAGNGTAGAGGTCGLDAFCSGGPGQTPQWPTAAVGGGSYAHDDVTACLGALQRAGVAVNGPIQIDVRTLSSVSVLSGASYDDHSTDHALIIIKSVGVLGQSRLNLLNPNALYCLKDVSVLSQAMITSCSQGNVVSTASVSVLSQGMVQAVSCQ